MKWYHILNPREWPGVKIKTGNNKIDGIYYNLLSNNHVSLAASGSIFLAANSGIKLISPSFVDASGIRCNKILSENYERINKQGENIGLYSGPSGGLVFKEDDNNLSSTSYFKYNESGVITFPSASPGSFLYVVPTLFQNGETIPSINKIDTISGVKFNPEETSAGSEGQPPTVISPANVDMSVVLYANSGISIGPNNDLDSYKGFLLTHNGSGNVAQWRPNTYVRENYDTSLPFDGLERMGINWIRYPRRPALILNGKLYIYRETRKWSPYPVFSSLDGVEKELGNGSDTLCVVRAKGNPDVEYIKFAFTEKAAAEQIINTGFNSFADRVDVGVIADPDSQPEPGNSEDSGSAACWIIDIFPEDAMGGSSTGGPTIPGVNVFVFSVNKGAYFPMQIEPEATGPLRESKSIEATALSGIVEQADDGTLLNTTRSVGLTFKPSTLNNISIRPTIHTAFNMLGEDIDFLIYGKEYTDFNIYDSQKFDLNDHLIPGGLTPVFKIDATIPNSIKGSPTGIQFTKFIDREKTKPVGWNFDYSGKVCIKTNEPYVLSSVVSGSDFLRSYADVTISGHTYTSSLIAEDIYLKPLPLQNNTGKYIRNALLTIDGFGKIISRTPRINPSLPGSPSGVVVNILGNSSCSLSWIAPEKDGDSKILNYLIQVSINGGENWIDLPITDNVNVIKGFDSQTSATIVAQNVTYINNGIFRVAAQNAVGVGDYSEATEEIFTNNLFAPNIPENFTFNRNIDSEILSDITLDWFFDNNMNWGINAGASGFVLEESFFDGFAFSSFSGIQTIDYINGQSLYSYNETGLNGKDNYLYRIRAINTNGIASSYNYVYSTGLLMLDLDLEEEENKRTEELTNFDFGVIMFTGTCRI